MMRQAVIVAALALGATVAASEPRRRPPPPSIVVVAPPVWWAVPAPLPYDYYIQQELAKRQPTRAQTFEGVSPRCARFFCEVTPP
jgi:hypothetical protein